MQLFPPEIIEHSTESHFARHSKSTQIIYVVVLIALLASIAVTPLIKVNVTTQSRGIIRSAKENSELQSAIYGQVEQNNLYENRKVHAGDTLVIMDTKSLIEQKQAFQRRINQNNKFINDLRAILNYLPEQISTAKYLSEYDEYLSKLNQQKLQSRYLLTEKIISDELFSKNVETEVDHNRARNNYERSINEEKLIHDQYHRQCNADLARLVQENIDYDSRFAQLKEEERKYCITAPITGRIIQCSGIQAGSFISPSMTLAQISPESNLLVECYVSPSDIGFFHQGMLATFQLDAYNYNLWGTASGLVEEISNDIVLIKDEPVFKVRCKLNTTHLQLKNGYKGELKKGMTLTGRFSLTERTLSQLLFDKVDNWMNPKLASN